MVISQPRKGVQVEVEKSVSWFLKVLNKNSIVVVIIASECTETVFKALD